MGSDKPYQTTAELVESRCYWRGRESAAREKRKAFDDELAKRDDFDPATWPKLSRFERADMGYERNLRRNGDGR